MAGRSTCGTVMLMAGVVFTILTVIFVAISFGTDYWLKFTVDRSELDTSLKTADAIKKNGRYTFSRNRGLFRECYPGNDTSEFLSGAANVVDSECFLVDLDIPDATSVPLSDDYLTRVHLLRCSIAFIAVGLFLLIITFVVGLVPLSCNRRSRWAFTSGFIAFLVAFFVAGGIAFFHGAEYLEKRKINDLLENETIKFYQQWPQKVKMYTDSDYGWSYALGWVGVAFAIITAIFFVIAGFYIGDERYDDRYSDREQLEKRGRGQDYAANGYDNRAFPMERQYPAGPYPYPPPMPYPGPYVQDLDSGRQLQPMPYWSWS